MLTHPLPTAPNPALTITPRGRKQQYLPSGVLSGRVDKKKENNNKKEATPNLTSPPQTPPPPPPPPLSRNTTTPTKFFTTTTTTANTTTTPPQRGAISASASASASASVTSPSPSAVGRPKGIGNSAGGKYGRCPSCATGRRIRQRYTAGHVDRFRFVCSNRGAAAGAAAAGNGDYDYDDDGGGGGGNGGCGYELELEADPAVNPGAFRDLAVGLLQTRLPWTKKGGERKGKGKGKGKAVATAGGPGLGMGLVPQGGGTPAPKRGCAKCLVGTLVKKHRDTFRWTEVVLECERAWDGRSKQWVGGCGYSIEIERKPFDNHDGGDGNGGGVGSGSPDGVASFKTKVEKRAQWDAARQREEFEEYAEELERAYNNPFAAAVMVAPGGDKLKNKVVVDLTEDREELPDRSPSPGVPASSAVRLVSMDSAREPIVLDDERVDDDAAEFDEFASDDELELMKLADQTVNDDMDVDDELGLIELADRVSAAQASLRLG